MADWFVLVILYVILAYLGLTGLAVIFIIHFVYQLNSKK